jgi:hypothetical protein
MPWRQEVKAGQQPKSAQHDFRVETAIDPQF